MSTNHPVARPGQPAARRRRLVSAVVFALVAAVAWTPFGARPPAASAADMVTVSHDVARTSYDPNEPALTPSDVTATDFGEQFATQVDGQVFATPLVVGRHAFVTTENNAAYSLSTANGAVEWQQSFGTPFPAEVVSCGDLTPTIGSTSTPVYDSATGTVYFTTKVADGPTPQQPHWYLQAVSMATGASRPGYPMVIQGTADNDPTVTFDPVVQMQRPGLLLVNGVVYVAFGSHCDYGKWRGWVMAINVQGAPYIQSSWVDEVGNGAGGGIWQAGGGLVSDGLDASGNPRIFLTTGNGISPPAGPGKEPGGQLAESLIRLGLDATGHLHALDFFSPWDASVLDLNDTDFGSGGPASLPDSFGTPSHPHLLVTVGKDGRVYLIDRDDLGGRGQGPNGTDAVVQTVGPFNGVWGHPAVYPNEGGYVYLVENNGPLRAYKRGIDSLGNPTLTSVGTSVETFNYTSGSPVVTSDGTAAGSGVVWATFSNAGGNGAQLRAYGAVPVNGVMKLLWSAPIGLGSKFTTVATANGQVLLGTRDGRVLSFGRPTQAALSGRSVDFGAVQVGSTAQATATFTASQSVQVTDLSVPGPFSVLSTSPALPATLSAGDTLRVTLSYTPTSWGDDTAQVTLTTSAGRVGSDVHGLGQQTGLGFAPNPLAFGEVITGANKTMAVTVSNTGTQPETITSSTGPSAPFAARLPANGTVVQPLNTLSIPVTYTPTGAGSFSQTLSLTTSSGTYRATVAGTSVEGHGQLTVTPTSVDFGRAAIGTSRTLSFQVSNSGNIPIKITLAKAPVGVFSTTTPLAEGLQLGPDDSITQTVTFTPRTVGLASDVYQINSDDGLGVIKVALSGRGVVGASLPTPPSGWTLNGDATMQGGDIHLTSTGSGQHGSAVSNTAIPSEGFDARFQIEIGGGGAAGADGQTFALLPAGDPVTALGAPGGALGFGGIDAPGTSVAVTFDTFQNDNDPSGNFVGLVNGWDAANHNLAAFSYLASSSNVAPLRTGTHDVDVTYYAGTLRVQVDGQLRFAAQVTLPASIRPAFTGGTGGMTDNHIVRNVTIISNPNAGDTTPPTLSLTAPASGATVRGTTVVSATATDAGSGVHDVAFLVDGGLVAADTTPTGSSWSASVDTTALTDGPHTVAAVATDNAGNTVTTTPVTVTVLNHPPVVVTITSPVSGATCSGQVPIKASVSGGTGTLSTTMLVDNQQIATQVGTSASVVWDTSTWADGPHKITVLGSDDESSPKTGSATVTCTTSNAPAVTITAPASGATVWGATQLSATALGVRTLAATTVPITSVVFTIDAKTVCTDTTAPYGCTWASTSVADGAHTLGVRATDVFGRSRTATRSVQVQNKAPLDASVNAKGVGAVTSPTFAVTGVDRLLAFVAVDGVTGKAQTTKVSSTGLTWSLVRRTNTATGAVEIWTAVTTGARTGLTVTATPATAAASSITVVALKGNRPLGASAGATAKTGAARASVATTAAGSWFFAVGGDPSAAAARTVAAAQPILSQALDTTRNATLWTQSAAPGAAATVTVTVSTAGPAGTPWNYAVVEVRR